MWSITLEIRGLLLTLLRDPGQRVSQVSLSLCTWFYMIQKLFESTILWVKGSGFQGSALPYHLNSNLYYFKVYKGPISCITYIFVPIFSVQFSSVQSLNHVWLFATPWIAAHQASLSITISRSSLRLTSIESVMPSSHLILCRPLLLLPPIPPSIRVFSDESTLPMRWPKYWSFSFSIVPSKEIPGLISFRMDWLDRTPYLQGSIPTYSGKEPSCHWGSIPVSGRSPGEGNGNPLQYCFLGNPMDKGAWWATVHGGSKVGHDFATKQQIPV